jgi:hypothetical protein
MMAKKPISVPVLETKHWKWIVDWALERCAENIARSESEIIRHTHFVDEPNCTQYALERPRQEAIDSERAFLSQYRKIHEALCKIKSNVMESSAEEFARQIAGTMNAQQEKEIKE